MGIKDGESFASDGTNEPTMDGLIDNDAIEEEKKKTEADAEVTKKPKGPLGSKCLIKVLVSRYNDNGDQETIEKDASYLDLPPKPHTDHALVSKQSFDADHKHTGTTLEINSHHLLRALHDVVKFYPGETLEFDKPITMSEPFIMLKHYREELVIYASESMDEDLKAHVDLLANYLEKQAGEEGLRCKKLIAGGIITFDLLWAVFRPGDLIHERKHGHDRLFRLRKAGYGEHKNNGPFFELRLMYTTFDGKKEGISAMKYRLYFKEEFTGSSPTEIASLSCHPLKYLPRPLPEKLIEFMEERGQRYLKIRQMEVMQYEGLMLYLKRPPFDYYNENACYDGTWLPETEAGRVVIDAKTFEEEAQSQRENQLESEDDKDESSKETSGTPGHLAGNDLAIESLLCPPYVYGFSLERKEWCKYFVDSLSPVQWKEKALEPLILPAHQKRLVSSLVSSHKFPDKARHEANLKGKGLVVLLHGHPGSGKTLTAELTAEHTKRALLSISTGELGSWEHRVSFELKRLLTYASLWQAVVLIDEADVFLEARGGASGGASNSSSSSTEQSLQQNALVAVFLRQLEYFQGILFLTSNRVGVFDPAVRSRVHLALRYADPGTAVRRRLWADRLAGLEREERAPELTAAAATAAGSSGGGEGDGGDGGALEAALDELERAPMNGREISNAVTTAGTIARDEGKRLGLEHLRIVVEVWQEFEDSLKNAEGAKS